MALTLELHDGKWMMYQEGQLRLASFILSTPDWSLDEVEVPYNDCLGDDPDNHSLVIQLFITDKEYKLDIGFDHLITDVAVRRDEWGFRSIDRLYVPANHGAYSFFKPTE